MRRTSSRATAENSGLHSCLLVIGQDGQLCRLGAFAVARGLASSLGFGLLSLSVPRTAGEARLDDRKKMRTLGAGRRGAAIRAPDFERRPRRPGNTHMRTAGGLSATLPASSERPYAQPVPVSPNALSLAIKSCPRWSVVRHVASTSDGRDVQIKNSVSKSGRENNRREEGSERRAFVREEKNDQILRTSVILLIWFCVLVREGSLRLDSVPSTRVSCGCGIGKERFPGGGESTELG